jgi:hypothetical protein
MRKPIPFTFLLIAAMALAWSLGLKVPPAAHSSALRTAMSIDLLVIVPLMFALMTKVWRTRNQVLAGNDH